MSSVPCVRHSSFLHNAELWHSFEMRARDIQTSCGLIYTREVVLATGLPALEYLHPSLLSLTQTGWGILTYFGHFVCSNTARWSGTSTVVVAKRLKAFHNSGAVKIRNVQLNNQSWNVSFCVSGLPRWGLVFGFPLSFPLWLTLRKQTLTSIFQSQKHGMYEIKSKLAHFVFSLCTISRWCSA